MVGVGPCREPIRDDDHDLQTRPIERRLGELEGGPDGRREVDFLESWWAGRRVALGQGIERMRQPDQALGLVHSES